MRTHVSLLSSLVMVLASATVVSVAGCGSDESGTPLRSGTLTAEYNGTAFTPVNGFATTYKGKALLGLGDGPLHCGSETNNDPPSGRNVAFSLTAMEPGTYNSVLVNMYENVSSFHGVGANQGTVIITSVTDESVVGTISFDYTASDGKHYAVSGGFDIVHCKP